jgi:hypothetical protein
MINHPPEMPDSNPPAREPSALESVDAMLFEAFQRPMPAPDLTRNIMGRLGYMKAAPGAVRKARFRRWAGRFATVFVALVAVGVGLHMYNIGPDARRAAPITIPSAIGSELQRQQDCINSMIRTIRQLTPKHGERAPSFISRPVEEPSESNQPLDEDVNRSAVAPVEWV